MKNSKLAKIVVVILGALMVVTFSATSIQMALGA